MKSICTMLIVLALTGSLSSQILYDTSYTKQWNSKTNNWENFDRIISTYDNSLITSELIQINTDDQWENYNFKAYYYNNGRVIEEFEQYWNDAKLKWEDNYRKLYTYDNEGKLTQITHQNIFKGKYINTSKEILIYTSDGKLKEKIIQKFVNKDVNIEEVWTNFLRYQYYYNSNDILTNENLAQWKDGSWENNKFNYNYSYDNNENIIEKTKSRVNGDRVKNLTKETYSYNDNGKLEEHNISTWNTREKNWINKCRAVYDNRYDGNNVSMLIQDNYNDHWINNFLSEFSGNYKILFGAEIADLMTFSVNPVDFGNKATVQFNNPYNEFYYVSILNADGEIIGSATTDKDQISLDTLNLDKGLYFVELQGSNLYSGKFSIE